MVRFSWLALFALLASFIIVGCPAAEDDSSNGDETSGPDSTKSPDTTEGTGTEETSSTDASMTLAENAYIDEDGDAVCPILGGKIADPSTAETREYEDTTYYFC